MKHLLTILIMCTFILACSSSKSDKLIDSIYQHTQGEINTDTATAFVALSNIALSEALHKRVLADYAKETNVQKRYFYEFLLAKRTQETEYINAFISSSSKNLTTLANNQTDWISIESPFYQHLASYGSHDDKALAVILNLAKKADGANLAIISTDLVKIKQNNTERFFRVANNVGLNKEDLNQLTEEE